MRLGFSILTIRTTVCLLYRTRKSRQAGKMHRVSHTHRRVQVHQEFAGGTMTEPHSLSEREDPSMLWRLRFATSFGPSTRMGHLNSNRTHTHAFYSPIHPSLPRRRETRPRDETQRLANQNNQVLELNSLTSRSAQRNIRIETTQVAVRDKQQEVGAPWI